jgi:hypothetical protein
MKVQIGKLEPNPYRDMANYPIDEVKVKALCDSINQTGFWDNILGREKDGRVQIAYGHHRLAALKRVMALTDVIDIPVKTLSDGMMIKIMANENMEEWKVSPRVIDETVRVTKKFLEENPEEMAKVKIPQAPAETKRSKETSLIAAFLGWGTWRVDGALERLRLIDEGVLDKESVESMPSDKAARELVAVVKEGKKKNRPVTIETQKKAAKRVEEEGVSPSEAVGNILFQERVAVKEVRERKVREETNGDFWDYVKETAEVVHSVSRRLDHIIEARKKSSVFSVRDLERRFVRENFYAQLAAVYNQVKEILKTDEKGEIVHEKDKEKKKLLEGQDPAVIDV